MLRPRRPLVATALVLLAGLAPATEVQHRIRLGFDVLPDEADATAEASQGSLSLSAESDVEYDDSGRMTLGYSARLGEQLALVVGGGLAIGRGTFEDVDDVDIEEAGGFVEVGVSLQVQPWFHLEGVVQLGAGSTQLTGDGEDADGWYWDGALLLRPVFTIAQRVQLFAQVGFIAHRSTFEEEEQGVDLKLELEQDGLIAGLGIGVAF